MRRFALMLAFALPLFGYEVRSSKYALSVEVKDGRYLVEVTDLVGKASLVSDELASLHGDAAKTFNAGELALYVRIHEGNRRLNAELRIERGTGVLEILQATWLTAPYQLPPAGAPLRVGGDVRAPVIVKRVEPEYTEEAKAARVSGIVIIEAVIDRNGKVVGTKVLKPLPFGLDQKAVDAVQQWEFTPATLNGDPVDVIFNLVVNFQLE